MSKEIRGPHGQNFSKRGFTRTPNQRKNAHNSRRHHRAETSDTSGANLIKTWTPLREAVANAPCCPGIYKIGLAHENWIDVVYIGSSSSERTLREVVTSIAYGYEGGERLAMMVVNPTTRKKLMIQWITSVYPEELIEDELEEYIASNHKIPEYNTPIDPSKGLYVVVDYHIPTDPNDVTILGSQSEFGSHERFSSRDLIGQQHNKCPHCQEKVLRFAMSNVRIY